jgi:hypothetical protein
MEVFHGATVPVSGAAEKYAARVVPLATGTSITRP